MGRVKNVAAERYPEQSNRIGQRVVVCFHYSPFVFLGTIVREDLEDPRVGIIRLRNGRYVLMTECQYAPVRPLPLSINVEPGNLKEAE